MSESSKSRNLGGEITDIPRALVHKRILDEAEQRPDAPMEAIARDVTGANTSLVVKVLEEYGDPAHHDGDEIEENVGSNYEQGENEKVPDEKNLDGSVEEQVDNGESQDDDVEPEIDDGEAQDVEGDGRKIPEADANIPEADVEMDRGLETDQGETADSAPSESEPSPNVNNTLMKQTQQESPAESTSSENQLEVPDAESLTEKQLETLREVHRDPEATQEELAERFGVTSATINQRVNSIDGFDWNDRRRFTKLIFRNGQDDFDTDIDSEISSMHERENDENELNDHEEAEEIVPALKTEGRDDEDGNTEFETICNELLDRIAVLTDQVERLEAQVVDGSDMDSTVWIEPELAHKVAHACLRSEQVSEDEELRIFNALINPVNE